MNARQTVEKGKPWLGPSPSDLLPLRMGDVQLIARDTKFDGFRGLEFDLSKRLF